MVRTWWPILDGRLSEPAVVLFRVCPRVYRGLTHTRLTRCLSPGVSGADPHKADSMSVPGCIGG